MITEYHLTSSAQGSSSLSPVLPEAARDLLPPVEDYVVGGAFQGTRDVRVVDRVVSRGGWDSLTDSGGQAAWQGPSSGSASSSNDEQPQICGGC